MKNVGTIDGSYAIIFTGNQNTQLQSVRQPSQKVIHENVELPKKDPVAVATAVLGIKVNPEKFFTTKRTRAFLHRYSEEYEYDPKTGKPLWTNKIAAISNAQSCPSDKNPYRLGRYKNWTAFSILEDKEHQILGVGCCSCGPLAFEQLGDISNIKQKLKEDLTPIGVWQEENFGLYSAFSIVDS